jgi:hypothetical protein
MPVTAYLVSRCVLRPRGTTRGFCAEYDDRTRPIGKGLLNCVADWHQGINWADLVILESNGIYLAELDHWR